MNEIYLLNGFDSFVFFGVACQLHLYTSGTDDVRPIGLRLAHFVALLFLFTGLAVLPLLALLQSRL